MEAENRKVELVKKYIVAFTVNNSLLAAPCSSLLIG